MPDFVKFNYYYIIGIVKFVFLTKGWLLIDSFIKKMEIVSNFILVLVWYEIRHIYTSQIQYCNNILTLFMGGGIISNITTCCLYEI